MVEQVLIGDLDELVRDEHELLRPGAVDEALLFALEVQLADRLFEMGSHRLVLDVVQALLLDAQSYVLQFSEHY